MTETLFSGCGPYDKIDFFQQPAWKPVLHKGKNNISLAITEYVKAVQVYRRISIFRLNTLLGLGNIFQGKSFLKNKRQKLFRTEVFQLPLSFNP